MADSTYLLFKFDDAFYGIDTIFIHEIIELPQLKRTIEMSPYLAGLLNFHGDIIQVVDLNLCLGFPFKSYSLNDFIIILKTPDFFFGFIVPDILNVVSLSETTLIHAPSLEKNLPTSPILSQLAKFDEQMAFILDPYVLLKKIMTSPESHEQMPLEYRSTFPMHSDDHLSFAIRAQNIAESLEDSKTTPSLIPLTVIILGQEYFGIDPEIIKEVIALEEFTPIPHAPPHLLGFLNLRGNVLTLLDIWPILKMQKLKLSPHSQILVLNLNDLTIGIIVDQVNDLIYLKTKDLQSIPIEIEGTNIETFAKHTVFYEKDILIMLDIFKILESIMGNVFIGD